MSDEQGVDVGPGSRQSRSVSAGSVCSPAQCELTQHGLTSLQRASHPLRRSSASDLCQGDEWHERRAADGRNLLFLVFGRIGSKRHFSLGGKRKDTQSFPLFLFPKSLCCVSVHTQSRSDFSAAIWWMHNIKPSDVFIQMSLNDATFSALNQWKLQISAINYHCNNIHTIVSACLNTVSFLIRQKLKVNL